MRLQDKEDKRRRRTRPTATGTIYQRVYVVDENDLDALPEEGDALPGESATVLGPFIIKNGINYGQVRQSGGQEVIITALLLKARGT